MLPICTQLDPAVLIGAQQIVVVHGLQGLREWQAAPVGGGYAELVPVRVLRGSHLDLAL